MSTGNYGVTGGVTGADPRYTSGASNRAISEKEQLANFISMITRDETPFMSSIGKNKAKAVYHEWQTDELEAPRNSRVVQGSDFASVRPDGDDGSDNSLGDAFTVPNRTRLGNYTQVNAKTVAVSNTKRAVDQAGVSDEYAYQLKKRGTEMRRDMENDLIHTLNTSSAGSATAAGRSGSVWSFLNTNIVVAQPATATDTPSISKAGITAAEEGIGLNTFSTATVAGTVARGELELDDIDAVMQEIYEQGGKAGRVMLSPKNRRVFSAKAQAAGTGTSENVRRNIDDSGKLTQAVSIYMSDFGELMIEPNYIMGLTSNTTGTGGTSTDQIDLQDGMALVYDPMWFKMSTLRPMQEVDVGQRGDSTVGMFVEEWSLEVTNPYGCGAIVNIGA